MELGLVRFPLSPFSFSLSSPPAHKQLSWFRIILDEAHYIKTRSTSTAKAVFALTSLNKWCLTGTPLQNRVGELYSLVRFLRMDPQAYYFCRYVYVLCGGCCGVWHVTWCSFFFSSKHCRILPRQPHSCKGCDCKSLNYRFGPNWDSCESCGHTPMFHFSHFNRNILNPIQRYVPWWILALSVDLSCLFVLSCVCVCVLTP